MMDVVVCIPTIQCGKQARNAYMVILSQDQRKKKGKRDSNVIFVVIVDVESSF